MEEALWSTSTAGIIKENMSLSHEREDILNPNILLSKDISPVKDENLKNPQTELEEETKQGVNGAIENDIEIIINDESSRISDFAVQKAVSPTLIESAFKVMKNLFSPDKSKSKSTTVLSPINQSSSGTPCSSLCIQGKTELFSPELETESQYNVQTASGEIMFKSHLASNETGIIQSPLTLDPLNNTDESFLTTVSLIDESFHSAVTHLDEHGEALKSGANLMENILNNSQNLGMMDPCNDTLKYNDSYLENTTLKIGSFIPDENKLTNVSVQSQDENMELLSTQDNNGIPIPNRSEGVPVIKFQCEELQENAYNSLAQNKDIKTDVEILTKISPERDNFQNTDLQKNLSTLNDHANNDNEIKSNCEIVKMSHIFLSKSFEQQMSENKIRVDDSNTITVKDNFSEVEPENEIRVGSSNDERNDCVENCISTTTVILSTVDSADIDNMLMRLTADDSETNTSSLTSFDSDDVTCSLENVPGKIPGKELDRSSVNKQSFDSSSSTSENFFSLTDDKKTCVSEINSTNNKPDPTKFKLNKSDGLISQKNSKERTERKKSLVDISLMKNSEAPVIYKEVHPYANDTDSLAFKAQNQSEIAKKEVGLPSHKADATGVISQQSYTILTACDNNLNRPIIEPLNISHGHFDKETFQMYQSNATESEKGSVNNCSYNSFNTEDLVKSSQIKQSTPLWEGHNESNQKFFRPNSLKLSSPVVQQFVCGENNEKGTNLNHSELDKEKQMFSHGEQVEFSPVNPVNDGEFFFNSVENEMRESFYNQLSIKILQSEDLNEANQSSCKQLGLNESKRSPEDINHTLNQSFDKKQYSPGPRNVKAVVRNLDLPANHKPNQTFDKKCKTSSRNPTSDKSAHNKLNLTFEKQSISPKKNLSKKARSPEVEKPDHTFIKKLGSPEINRTNQNFGQAESPKSGQLNKTYDKFSEPCQLNRSFDKKADFRKAQMLNHTFEKKPPSPLPCETTRILDKTSESPGRNQNNQTYCKETDFINNCREKKVQEMNNAIESLEIKGEPEDFGVISKSDVKDSIASSRRSKSLDKREAMPDALNSLPSEDKTALDLDFHVPENLDKANKNILLGSYREINDSSINNKGLNNSLVCANSLTAVLNENEFLGNQCIEELSAKLGKTNLNVTETQCDTSVIELSKYTSVLGEPIEGQNPQSEGKFLNFVKEDNSPCEPDLVQLIQEQFSSNDIEKICSVVHNLSSIKLNNDILKANEQFDQSFHENIPDSETIPSERETKPVNVNALSPKSFDFLSSIRGKPTGRDLSRESLYVKFDPLVQPSANSLIDFTKEGEVLPTIDASPVNSHTTSVCEQLLAISPQKKPDDIVPPLTPLSHKIKINANEDKTERLKELQNEIYFLKNLYAERERSHKIKMEDYDSQIAKLTGETCMLEDKLKESNEREKSLVKKMKEQTQSIGQLKIIMEEYVKVISKLSAELEVIKKENVKQTETLSLEKDSYMTHLQNTEAAFTDVHAKYEKSKKTIVSLKLNETMFRNKIAEQTQRLEEFKVKAREAQEKALIEFQKIQEALNETKANHSQEIARLRAQLRKTELKVEALQESLDQKIKENEQLTAICDELIEGKK